VKPINWMGRARSVYLHTQGSEDRAVEAIATTLASTHTEAHAAGKEEGREEQERIEGDLRAHYAARLGLSDAKSCWDDLMDAAKEEGLTEAVAATHAEIARLRAMLDAAREEGRLAGLEEAARACASLRASIAVTDHASVAERHRLTQAALRIRSLPTTQPARGGGREVEKE
jgi:hypothetical protein